MELRIFVKYGRRIQLITNSYNTGEKTGKIKDGRGEIGLQPPTAEY